MKDGVEGTFTLKVHNGVESDNKPILDAQNKMLEHLNAAGITCPQPMWALAQEEDEYDQELYEDHPDRYQQHSQGQRRDPVAPSQIGWTDLVLGSARGGTMFKKHAVRLLSWVEGTPMSKLHNPPLMLYHAVGQHLAKTHEALESFDHHAAHRRHSWDLLNTASLRGFLYAIDSMEQQEVVEGVINKFVSISGFQKNVPWQVLHADFNDANMVLEEDDAIRNGNSWRVSGILDVGDMVYSCRVNDLAIGMAYMLISAVSASKPKEEQEEEVRRRGQQLPPSKPVDPIEAAATFYGGYASKMQLLIPEKEALHTLVACRLAISFTYGMYSYSQDPTNEYLLQHATPAYEALCLWLSVPEDEMMQRMANKMVANAYR
eukprot:TRINITY_DN4624_c0_g1_i3.p1 TRINITY_DN4624_c0_g1~~TRINITY_DN4624_c0_g1_i3.p1  ORF type:complete len:375 (+),score=94.72 TRINITY_DN4624_c0_g1_i3:323-1447(+)